MSAVWKIRIGQKVTANENIYEITHFLDAGSILVKNTETGKSEKLSMTEISPFVEGADTGNTGEDSALEEIDLFNVPEGKWNEALRREESVRRILALPDPTRTQVAEEAATLGVSTATMYRYINAFALNGKASSLIPHVSDGGRGTSRLDESSEKILEETISDYYLKKQSPKVGKVVEEYERRCFNAKIKPAHPNTVRNRIDQIDHIEKAKKRKGKNALRGLLPTPGEFPEGDYPFQVVQVDHTLVDLQFVDDVTRLPIGRLWLTVMIEVFSRMILGFYLSPDRPSINSIGLCMAHAVLPKEKELIRLGVEGDWNCWGLMNKLHADNGSDFRSADLQRACREYGIDIEWRPVGRPHYGAHIERLLGTFMAEVHTLPGTTYSNINEKGDKDPEKDAVFTYTGFEKWLTTYITGVYHKTKHEGIGMSPETKFERGLFVGNEEFGPTGPPPKVVDERKFRIDFMPTYERTVQPFGVEIDFVRYYDSVLAPFIGAKDPKKPKDTRKFLFRQNPRETAKIYFYHPDLKQYLVVPYRNRANPQSTVWELKKVRDKLKADGVKIENEEQIFGALNKMREIEQSEVTETKTARRKAQNQRIYEEQKTRHAVDPKDNDKKSETKSRPAIPGGYASFFNISEDDITPLEVEDF